MPLDIHSLAMKEALANAPANQLVISTAEFHVPRLVGTPAIVRMTSERGDVLDYQTGLKKGTGAVISDPIVIEKSNAIGCAVAPDVRATERIRIG